MPEFSSRAVAKGVGSKSQPVTSSSGKDGAAPNQNGHSSRAQPRKGGQGKAGAEHSARPGVKQAGAGRALPHKQLDRGATGGHTCSWQPCAVYCKQVFGRACRAL